LDTWFALGSGSSVTFHILESDCDEVFHILDQDAPRWADLLRNRHTLAEALNPCVPVQDAALEAARSSSDHTDMADEQAGTQALPLCHHGYYATRCPACLEDAT
jgi:hypothetical protein